MRFFGLLLVLVSLAGCRAAGARLDGFSERRRTVTVAAAPGDAAKEAVERAAGRIDARELLATVRSCAEDRLPAAARDAARWAVEGEGRSIAVAFEEGETSVAGDLDVLVEEGATPGTFAVVSRTTFEGRMPTSEESNAFVNLFFAIEEEIDRRVASRAREIDIARASEPPASKFHYRVDFVKGHVRSKIELKSR